MIDLYLTEKALAKTGVSTTTLVATACMAKQIKIIETGASAKFEVEFRDGSPTGRVVAHLLAGVSLTDSVKAEAGEAFHFNTNITVNVMTGSGLVQVYTPGNPLPTFA